VLIVIAAVEYGYWLYRQRLAKAEQE